MPNLTMPITWASEGIFFLWSHIQVLDLVRAAKGYCVPYQRVFSQTKSSSHVSQELTENSLDRSFQGRACNEANDNYGVEN